MDFKDIKGLVLELANLVVIYNGDLKKGIIATIIPEVENVINEFNNEIPNLHEITVLDPNLGLNIVLSGLTGKILYPAILFKNSFRMQFIKNMKFFISQEITFNEFEMFISKSLIATQDVKKGGFAERTLEVLRFYLTNFDKVMDFDVKKFLPYFENYTAKYITFSSRGLEKRFPLTQKYSTYYLLPKYRNFGLRGVMISNEDDDEFIIDESTGLPFGLLFNNKRQKQFSFYFTKAHYNRNFKANYIEKICFFENLDLFHVDEGFENFTNKTMDMLDIYYSYKEGNFIDSSISFEIEFDNTQRNAKPIDNLDLLIHLYNTRKLPLNHEIHPISKYLLSYRNKLVKFYSTINYFIYIYEPKGKKISRHVILFLQLIKNTFSNGYIFQGKSYLLISTYLFKKDFENQKNSLIEFVYSFKLKIKIFENLNNITFSFYQLPSSAYFDIEENVWNFPILQERPIEDLLMYQSYNLELERVRLQDNLFKHRIETFLENWTNEIKFLEEC